MVLYVILDAAASLILDPSGSQCDSFVPEEWIDSAVVPLLAKETRLELLLCVAPLAAVLVLATRRAEDVLDLPLEVKYVWFVTTLLLLLPP